MSFIRIPFPFHTRDDILSYKGSEQIKYPEIIWVFL